MYNRIRIARGTNETIAKRDQNLEIGQPLYNKDKGYLTIGSTDSNGNALNVSQCPIKVRELKGWYDDATSAGTNISETLDNNFFYFGQDYNSANTKTVARGIKYLELRVNDDTFISLDNNSSTKGIYINKPIQTALTINGNITTQNVNTYTIKPRSNDISDIGTDSLKYKNGYINTIHTQTINNTTFNGTDINATTINAGITNLTTSLNIGSATKLYGTSITSTDLNITNILTNINTKNITGEHIYNKTNNTYDIGSSSKKFRAAYVNTLNVNTINIIT